ncbi:nuclear transcription factor Y subunit beta-like [Cephus cinctus]|uniref:Nuclear transcription factor Y subunit beta-like n=1 Tax=Cephus cinctus TaxID=211228 RepID=A0AAJ7RVF3_CEPCN|nr:nuclear transcription factor Y subunit beta-like [Cephus cinctus]
MVKHQSEVNFQLNEKGLSDDVREIGQIVHFDQVEVSQSGQNQQSDQETKLLPPPPLSPLPQPQLDEAQEGQVACLPQENARFEALERQVSTIMELVQGLAAATPALTKKHVGGEASNRRWLARHRRRQQQQQQQLQLQLQLQQKQQQQQQPKRGASCKRHRGNGGL